MLSNDEILLKHRIRQLLKFKKMTISDIAETETLRARYGRQINGDASVPFTTIHLLLRTFPDISADWLIMGDGSMNKADHLDLRVYNEVHNSTAGGSINVGATIQMPVQQIIDEKDKRIAELEKDKQLLQGVIAAFTKK